MSQDFDEHMCSFPEVLIESTFEADLLESGMHILTPCSLCGERPKDYLTSLSDRHDELEKAMVAVKPNRPLYHWSPSARCKQINRYGLRPNMRPTTSSTYLKTPYVCLADSPSWAWALSGGMNYTADGEWHLWMTYLNHVENPIIHSSSNRPSGFSEIRTQYRIPKRNLWYVGLRTKTKTRA